MEDDVLTKKEASRYLKISISTLDRLMKTKDIPYSKINGRVLFLKKDLIQWIESKKIK